MALGSEGEDFEVGKGRYWRRNRARETADWTLEGVFTGVFEPEG